MLDGHAGTGAEGTTSGTYTVQAIYDISTESKNVLEKALAIAIADLSDGTVKNDTENGFSDPELAIGWMWSEYSKEYKTEQKSQEGRYGEWIDDCKNKANSAGSSTLDLEKSGDTKPEIKNTINGFKCVGPFELTYGDNKVNSVKINGSPKEVYYSEETNQSAFDNKKLVSAYGVPNGKKFYLWIEESDLESNQNVTVEFVQNFTYYKARLIFLTGVSLQNCMSYKGSKEEGSTSVSYTLELDATLVINKKDGWSLSGSDQYVGSYKVTIKNTSTNKYYDENGAEHSSPYNVNVSSSNGLKITGLPVGIYEITEVEAPVNYSLIKQVSPPQTEGANRTKYKETTGNLTPGSITKVTLQNVKYTDINIIKKDSSSKEGISGIYFTIQDDNTKEYIAANGSRQTSPVEIKTGQNGIIEIKDILIPYEGTTFTVKEVRSENAYYYVPSNGYTFKVRAANNYAGKISYVTSSTGDIAYSSGGEIYNKKAYSLTLNKIDEESKAAVAATFNVQYEDGTWLTEDGNYSSEKSNIQTTHNGSKKISVKKGTYHVYEVGIESKYKLELQDGYDPKNKWIDFGTITVDDNNKDISKTMYNKKYANLEIKKLDSKTDEPIEGIGFTIYHKNYNKYIKSDGSKTDTPTILYTDKDGLIHVENVLIYNDRDEFIVKEVASNNLYYKSDTSITGTIYGSGNGTAEWSTTTIKNTKPYSLTVKKEDPDKTTEKLTAYFYIQYEDGTWLTESGDYSSKQSSITVDQSLKISEIKRGKYHIYEYKTPTGYDIKQQAGYGDDKSYPTWVDCGIAYVGVNNNGKQDNSVCNVTLTKDNKKYISKITGYVWLDNRTGKANEFDYLYGSGDEKLSGIKVEFLKKDGTVIQSTTTKKDGSYSFEFSKKVLYWDLQNYMVRFTYDNENYTTVPVNLDVSKINASRAMENYDWRTDSLATGSGLAITIPNATKLEDSIAKYYNNDNYCIETINLGLMMKPKEDFSIIENIDYVLLKKGDYTFKYEYGKAAVVQDVPERQYIYDTIALQNSARTFTQKLYPSDIAYNYTNPSDKFEVYVVYNISITNTMTINMNDLYVEKSLNITSLTNTYNSSIYEIADSNWQNTGTGTARYNNTIEAISSGKVANISIQFKVTETGLQELIQGAKTNPEVYKDCATTAIADGYHKYDRNDYSWTYSSNSYKQKNEHRTEEKTRESSALTLKLKLADQRTISGSVFEDTQTSESQQNHTRLGNGIYDDNENKLKVVTVSLLNKEDEKLASLYSTKGEYLKKNADGSWTFTKQDAEVKVNDDGTYSLEGVIPGEYYLRFTYSNGTQIITDTSGNPINLVNYKSTILTGAAANNSNSDWYLDVMGGKNSIATDKYYIDKDNNSSEIIPQRTTSDTEINYTTQNYFNEGKIQAFSAAMNIQFEYLKETEKDYDYNFMPECSGMCFGIIERPHTEIELEKIISNIKLTLSNGTTIINGNPQDSNVSQYLTSMNKSYAKVEMDNSYLYGSTAIITYKLTAINKSELDYATEKYYRLGNIDDPSKLVKTTVTKIIDYLSDKNCNYVSISENATLASDSSKYAPYGKEGYFAQGVINANSEYKDQLLVTSLEELSPQSAHPESSSTDYTVTVNKLLSNLDDNLGWESYSEIIGLKNVTFTAQYSSHSGNYKAGDAVSYSNGGTSEADNADSIIAVTPSTGENRSYTIYIVAGAVLIVLAGGIVIIKKFVL